MVIDDYSDSTVAKELMNSITPLHAILIDFICADDDN
jgi:hypothetical protein